MKPKKIRILESELSEGKLIEGKVYPVDDWKGNYPSLIAENGLGYRLFNSKWEPVQDFKHGDPVWAWNRVLCRSVDKIRAIYVDRNPVTDQHIVCLEGGHTANRDIIEHRKPQITLKELEKRADIDLDEYEVVG